MTEYYATTSETQDTQLEILLDAIDAARHHHLTQKTKAPYTPMKAADRVKSLIAKLTANNTGNNTQNVLMPDYAELSTIVMEEKE